MHQPGSDLSTHTFQEQDHSLFCDACLYVSSILLHLCTHISIGVSLPSIQQPLGSRLLEESMPFSLGCCIRMHWRWPLTWPVGYGISQHGSADEACHPCCAIQGRACSLTEATATVLPNITRADSQALQASPLGGCRRACTCHGCCRPRPGSQLEAAVWRLVGGAAR